MKKKIRKEHKIKPFTLKEEPTFQEVMKSMSERRKSNAGKQRKKNKG